MDITLYHYDFESDNQNVLLFDDKTQRDNYFASQSDKKSISNINFFANDIMQTKVYVRVDDLSLFTLLNYNYTIVTNSTGETAQKPLFYFIKSSRQDSGGQIELTLKCDLSNTYLYDVDMTKWQGILQRVHLDRFKQIGTDDNYIYAFGSDSKLFERERIKDVAKRATERKQLYFNIDTTTNSKFNQWLRDNVAGWKYYFLASNVSYSHMYYFYYDNEHLTETIESDVNYNSLEYVTEPNKHLNNENFLPTTTNSNFIVLCCPIYKNANLFNQKNLIKIRQQTNYANTQTVDYIFDESGILQFLEKNNKYANVLAVKFSTMPPFNPSLTLTENTDFEIDINDNLILTSNRTERAIYGYDTFDFVYSSPQDNPVITNPTHLYSMLPIIYVNKQYLYENYKLDCDLSDVWNHTKAEIKATYYEPKLNNEDYSEYKLIIGGQQHKLPISKTSNAPKFQYSEILSPDITKAQLIYDVTNSANSTNLTPVYKEISQKDFTGFSITLDLSMWFPQNALQDYLASNKNYLQIFNNQQAQKFLGGTVSAVGAMVGGAVSGNYTGISQGIGLAPSTSKSIIDLYYNRENLDLTINNMANTPESLANINSNPMLINAVQKDLSIYIEKMEMLPFEQGTMIDYFKQFGYTYNRLSTISEHIKTRKYYNYVQANIFEIPDKLGNNVKEAIKLMFANGIRFWHYDSYTGVDFTQNNYERFLDNE